MRRVGFPVRSGGLNAGQWVVRCIEVDGFKPSSAFAERIKVSNVTVWVNGNGQVMIATFAEMRPTASDPSVNLAESVLNQAEEQIAALEEKILEELGRRELMMLVSVDDRPVVSGEGEELGD